MTRDTDTSTSVDAATRLVRALKEANAPHGMILNAQGGYYGDFTSSLPMPITQLVNDLYAYNLHALAKRAMNGEFDGR